MSDELRCPRCRVQVNRGARFCGMCQCALPADDAPGTDHPPAALPPAVSPNEAWVPSGVTPVFHERKPAPKPLPGYPETPEGVVAALEDWKRALPLFERLKLRRARSEAEVRSALSFFDEGRGPPPVLLAWFRWWDGQRDSGCWEPRSATHACSLAEAVDWRQSLLGLGEPWSNLKGWTNWLPLFNHGGDVTLFVAGEGLWGLCYVDHETPHEVLEEWDARGGGDPLTEYIAEATVAWRR